MWRRSGEVRRLDRAKQSHGASRGTRIQSSERRERRIVDGFVVYSGILMAVAGVS